MELQGTSGPTSEWRDIVKMVRLLYPGTLTYGANHGEETSVQWWDALDAIGVDGYYALTQLDDPTLAQLRAAWQPTLTRLADFALKWHPPTLLTAIADQYPVCPNTAQWGI